MFHLGCQIKISVMSFDIGSIDARTWRGYRLYRPRMGPIDNFSLVTWLHVMMTSTDHRASRQVSDCQTQACSQQEASLFAYLLTV